MALNCVIAGLLNLAKLISPQFILLILSTGMIFFFTHLVTKRKPITCLSNIYLIYIKENSSLSILLFILLVFTLFFGSLHDLNTHDDFHGYLNFAHQMLQSGHISFDPFNERRITTLGGQSYLNATLLTLLPLEFLPALENILARFIFIMLVIFHGARKKVKPLYLFTFMVLLLLADPPTVNLSSLITSLLIFYILIQRFCLNNLHEDRREQLLTAILVAALLSLKVTNIVGLVIITGVLVCFANPRPYWKKIYNILSIFLTAGLLLFPWMVSSFISHQTFFYPLLGKGTQVSWHYGAAPQSLRLQDIDFLYILSTFTSTLCQPHIFSIILILLFYKRKSIVKQIDRNYILGFFSAFAAALILSFVSLKLLRYFYPFTFAASTILFVELLSTNLQKERTNKITGKKKSPLAFYCLLIYFIVMMPAAQNSFQTKARALRVYLYAPPRTYHTDLIRSAQQSVPYQKSIMAVLSQPFLLDFKRNPIFTIDHAGSAGLKGKFPIFDSTEKLIKYLYEAGIDYMIYSHHDEGGYEYSLIHTRLDMSGTPYFDRKRVIAQNNILFRNHIAKMLESQEIVYSDPYSIVISLRESAE